MMGRRKGKIQKIYFQIKNRCIDLERNGFIEAGGLTANSLKNSHTGDLLSLPSCQLSPQCCNAPGASPCLGRSSGGAQATSPAVTLPGCEDQPQRWQERKSAQVC